MCLSSGTGPRLLAGLAIAGRYIRSALLVTVLLGLSAESLRAQTITYVYDELDRLVGVIDPSGETATYTYDAVGNLLSIARYSATTVTIIHLSPGSAGIGGTV